MGHIICPWNIMWHNMTPGHLYVKVNISAWQFDKSGQGSCQCGFILAAEKEVLWHRVVMKCVCGTLCVCVCRACVHKFNPHRHKSLGLAWKGVVRLALLFFFSYWKHGQTVDHRASQKQFPLGVHTSVCVFHLYLICIQYEKRSSSESPDNAG